VSAYPVISLTIFFGTIFYPVISLTIFCGLTRGVVEVGLHVPVLCCCAYEYVLCLSGNLSDNVFGEVASFC
jgi:hypothetical protein